jgi:excisionase family DNA binding protein
VTTINRRTPIDQLPEFLRVDETAQYLDCNEATVYDLAQKGTLRCFRVGRLLRIHRSALLELPRTWTPEER